MGLPNTSLGVTVALSWAARLAAVVIGIVNIRLTVDALGLEGFAATSLIVSLLPWAAVLALGLPKSIQNKIGRLKANASEAGAILAEVNGAVLWLSAASLPVCLMVAWLLERLIGPEYKLTLIGYFGSIYLMALQGIASTYSQALYAFERPLWPNTQQLFVFATQSVMLLWAIYIRPIQLDVLIVALALPGLIAGAISFAMLGSIARNLALKKTATINLLKEGRDFAWFALLSAATVSLDYIIVAYTLEPHDVARYGIVTKPMLVILSFHSILLATLWSKVTRAHVAADRNALLNIARRATFVGLLLVVLGALSVAATMPHISSALTGNRLYSIDVELVAAITVLIMLRAWTDTLSVLLMAMGRVDRVVRIIPVHALVAIIVQIYLARQIGLVGVPLGAAAAYIAVPAWILWRSFKEHLPPAGGTI